MDEEKRLAEIMLVRRPKDVPLKVGGVLFV